MSVWMMIAQMTSAWMILVFGAVHVAVAQDSSSPPPQRCHVPVEKFMCPTAEQCALTRSRRQTDTQKIDAFLRASASANYGWASASVESGGELSTTSQTETSEVAVLSVTANSCLCKFIRVAGTSELPGGCSMSMHLNEQMLPLVDGECFCSRNTTICDNTQKTAFLTSCGYGLPSPPPPAALASSSHAQLPCFVLGMAIAIAVLFV